MIQLRSTVTGRIGQAGAHALNSVTAKALVLEVDIEIAQIRLQRLEASIVRMDFIPRTIFAPITVLCMDSGAIGRLGRPAVKPAAKGPRLGHGTVTIRSHMAVGRIVWALHWRKKNV